jgi:MFS superfamily sulfate permease-like transporter
MKHKLIYYRSVWLKFDLPAGLAVFLVALPLCLGIALASNAPLYAGLLSGIIGGLVVSLISGSQLCVSGPAAGLATLVSASILSSGSFNVFLLSVIIAGFFQLILGVFKLGGIGNYFPSAVIKGMLAGIGIIIIAKQIPLSLGYDQTDFWSSGFLDLFRGSNFFASLNNLESHLSINVITITFWSVAIIYILKIPFFNKFKKIPIALLIVIFGVLLNLFFNKSNFVFLKETQLVNIPLDIFSKIAYPDLKELFTRLDIWKNGITIGLLATLETLLSVEAIDQLDIENRVTPVNRELVAQGIGNMLCGFLGAIPITAVIVRGAANVQAGAKTKLSAFTHGLFLLIAVLLIPRFLNLIPLASLAIVLFLVGYNLTHPKLFINLWRLGAKQFLPFIITIFTILLTDLLVGVCIGLLISSYIILQNNVRAEYNLKKTKEHETDVYTIKLDSNVTFLNKVKIRKVLDEIPEYSKLVIDASETHYLDFDILDILQKYNQAAHLRHIQVELIGINKFYQKD